MLPVVLRAHVAARKDVGHEQESYEGEEQRERKLFIKHVILLVWSNAGQEEIMTVGEDLCGRLKTSDKRLNLLQANDG